MELQQRPRVTPSGLNISSNTVTSAHDPDAADLRHLIISGGSAAVIVQSGEKLHLELVVEARGRTHSEAEENARMATLEIESGPTTKVGLSLPSGVSYGMLTIRVTAPESVNLTINTSSGHIEVVDRKADVTTATSSGALKVESVEGLVDLRSSSGSISARQIEGRVSAISSSGAIRIEQAQGDVEASTTSGSVSVIDAEGKVATRTNSGTVAVEARTVGGDYDLEAVSGSVRFSFPNSAGLTIDARTSSGSINGPGWLVYGEGRGSATGSQGDGSYRASIRTSSGSIFLADR